MRTIKDKDLIISALISIAAHAIFLGAAAFVYLGSFTPPVLEPKKEFHVKITSDKPIRRLPVSRAGSEGPVTTMPGYGGPVSDTLATGSDDKAGSGLERDEDFTDFLVRGQMEDDRALPDKRMPGYAKVVDARRKVREDIVSTDKDALIIERQVELESGQDEVELPKEFITEMPGFTPVSSIGSADAVSYKPLRGSGGTGALGGGSGGGAGIDEYLMADLVVYKDPADGRKYFKITIMSGKEVDRFKVIPKDIIFLVDCSLSIQSELGEFKKGMNYCLDNLGKKDTFNIMKFDSSTKSLAQAPLDVSTDSIMSAKMFIDRLQPSSITNLYDALASALDKDPKRRPSYVVVLSDGRPTAGIKNSRQIIHNITAENKTDRPIFFFCGAGRVNRYLVDFLTLCNRGWAEYAGQPDRMYSGLSSFYDKIRDPIILSPKYRFSGVDASETYPKSLPDFFRGVSFVIYGMYEDEGEFSVQITGDGAEERLEFVFADSFKRARQGTRDIARQWAYNKIYHLIGILAEKGSDPAIVSQIGELYEKFDITTPYGEGIK